PPPITARALLHHFRCYGMHPGSLPGKTARAYKAPERTLTSKTDAAVEAVGAFVRHSPVFEGGELRLCDNREQHLSAWVRWSSEPGGNAVSVLKRENVFQDGMLAILARHVEAREAVRENLVPGVRVCV